MNIMESTAERLRWTHERIVATGEFIRATGQQIADAIGQENLEGAQRFMACEKELSADLEYLWRRAEQISDEIEALAC